MSWERDNYVVLTRSNVVGTRNVCRGNEILCRGNDISSSGNKINIIFMCPLCAAIEHQQAMNDIYTYTNESKTTEPPP